MGTSGSDRQNGYTGRGNDQDTPPKEVFALVTVQVSGKSAAKVAGKTSAPTGPARMVLLVPDGAGRRRRGGSKRIAPAKEAVLPDESAVVVAGRADAPERLLAVIRWLSALPWLLWAVSGWGGQAALPYALPPPSAPTPPNVAESLQQLLDASRKGGACNDCFVQPSPQALRRMFNWTLSFASSPGPPKGAPRGFELSAVRDRKDLYVLHEISSNRSGGGVYAFRRGWNRPLIVEVPPSFADLQTLPAGVALFEGLEARALLVNTVNRKHACNEESGDCTLTCGSDVAHCADTYFHQVHRGLLESAPHLLVIAIHGFRQKPDDPAVILSAAGTDADIGPCAQALEEALPGYNVWTYPDQIDRLGGKTGEQARHLRRLSGNMLHLEMARSLRSAIASDREIRTSFVAAFKDALLAGSR